MCKYFITESSEPESGLANKSVIIPTNVRHILVAGVPMLGTYSVRGTPGYLTQMYLHVQMLDRVHILHKAYCNMVMPPHGLNVGGM